MTLDIIKLREQTPGSNEIMHFNNAGAALMPTPVIDAMKSYLEQEILLGGYEAANYASQKLQHFYTTAAQLIHANPAEIAFVDCATRAWDMIYYSFDFKAGDTILTCQSEYASNYLAFLHQAKKYNLNIQVIANDESGQIDVNDLKNQIDSHIRLIAITHVPTQGGLINPAAAVGEVAQQAGIPYLLDTTQSVGQMPIDVQQLKCDFLCATGRKFLRGPRGSGFLYANQNWITKLHPPFVDLQSATWIADNEYQLRDDARRFETWEQNMVAKMGLTAAMDYAQQVGLDLIWERIQRLAQLLRQKLAIIPTITLQDLGKQQCGIVTFTSRALSAQEIQKRLHNHGINVSVSLPEYARLDLVKRQVPALVRASVHYYNTETEIEHLCKKVRDICAES